MLCTSCSSEVKPIVAVDIDGTMGQYHTHFLQFAEGYLGRGLSGAWDGTGNWEDYLEIPRRQYEDVKLAFRQGGMKRNMPVFPGASDLTWWMRDNGIEIWVTTTRPYNRLDSVDPDTREWLRRRDISFDHLLYDEDKYQRLSEIVDDPASPSRVIAVFDDLPLQVVAAAASFGSPAAWLKYDDHNKRVHKNFNYVYNLTSDGGMDHPTALSVVKDRLKAWRSQHD